MKTCKDIPAPYNPEKDCCKACHFDQEYTGEPMGEIPGMNRCCKAMMAAGFYDHWKHVDSNQCAIHVNLTDKEVDALRDLSKRLELPMDRVMLQALRFYQYKMLALDKFPSPGCGIIE